MIDARSRRQVLRAFGGLVGTTLGVHAVSDQASAAEEHYCCSIVCEDGSIHSGCFNKVEGGCREVPPGCTLNCRQRVRNCGDCGKSVCPSTKKG